MGMFPVYLGAMSRVYVQLNSRNRNFRPVVDYIGMGGDVALAATAFLGTYYASVASGLFRGDPIMERVWRLATAAFVIVAFFSVLDFMLTFISSPILSYHLVRFAAVFAIAVFVVAAMVLVRWGKMPMEPKTQLSRQYPQR
jgi:hypothetical protein